MILRFPDGRELDLTGSFPFTFGDWRALQKRGVLKTINDLQGDRLLDPEVLFQILWRAVEKTGKGFTEEDVDTLELTPELFVRLASGATGGEPAPAEDPTTASSTSSAGSTAGDPPT